MLNSNLRSDVSKRVMAWAVACDEVLSDTRESTVIGLLNGAVVGGIVGAGLGAMVDFGSGIPVSPDTAFDVATRCMSAAVGGLAGAGWGAARGYGEVEDVAVPAAAGAALGWFVAPNTIGAAVGGGALVGGVGAVTGAGLSLGYRAVKWTARKAMRRGNQLG